MVISTSAAKVISYNDIVKKSSERTSGYVEKAMGEEESRKNGERLNTVAF